MERAETVKDMFARTKLSTSNYDALLIGWAKQNVRHGLDFEAGWSLYTPGGEAEAARTELIEEKGWTIRDGGANPTLRHLRLETGTTRLCPLCLDDKETVYVTRCGHSFCVDCLARWSHRCDTCPICRTPL